MATPPPLPTPWALVAGSLGPQGWAASLPLFLLLTPANKNAWGSAVFDVAPVWALQGFCSCGWDYGSGRGQAQSLRLTVIQRPGTPKWKLSDEL